MNDTRPHMTAMIVRSFGNETKFNREVQGESCVVLPTGKFGENMSFKKYKWRIVFTIEFEVVASPHVRFTRGITHSHRGKQDTDVRDTRVNEDKTMSNITAKALQKLLSQFHIPSSAAGTGGHPNHYLSFLMGDWNVDEDAFREEAQKVLNTLGATTVRNQSFTAKDLAAPYSNGHKDMGDAPRRR